MQEIQFMESHLMISKSKMIKWN